MKEIPILRLVLPEGVVAPKSEPDLRNRAAHLYPQSLSLQNKWVRAVSVLRTTRKGWCLDDPATLPRK